MPESKWIVLYMGRWLKAPVQDEEGSPEPRTRHSARRSGQPTAGQSVSALRFRSVDGRMIILEMPFERYADDIMVHCRTE